MDELTKFYLGQGVLGAAVVALGWAFNKLWVIREAERKEHKDEIAKITEQRLLEMQSLVTVVRELKQQQADFLAYKKDQK